jgi:hypothetical protein
VEGAIYRGSYWTYFHDFVYLKRKGEKTEKKK